MKSERETAKERWTVILKMARNSFPYGSVEILDKGWGNRYWNIAIRIKKID
ncbi:MAG: hypothetical protein AB1488_11440 [Nitrospirota bacterium]